MFEAPLVVPVPLSRRLPGTGTEAPTARLRFRQRWPSQSHERDVRRTVDSNRQNDRADTTADEELRAALREVACGDWELACRERTEPGQHDLTSMRMARQDGRNAQSRGLDHPSRVVRQK